MKTPKPLDLPPAPSHTPRGHARILRRGKPDQAGRDRGTPVNRSKTTLSPREKKLRLSDAKKIFREIKITPEPNFRQVRSEEDSLQS